jgi:hypothetical protein
MHVFGVDEHELVPHVSSLKLHVQLFVLKIVNDYLANWDLACTCPSSW